MCQDRHCILNGLAFLQELLLRVGALGHIVPLLFGYDATHDSSSQPDHFDYTGAQKAQGPAFLGLGIQRSNMQVALFPDHWLLLPK